MNNFRPVEVEIRDFPEVSLPVLTLLRSNLVVKLHGAALLCWGSGHR